MADLCEIKVAEDKTDLMVWLGFSNILKILLGLENMETFMENATLRVTIFL